MFIPTILFFGVIIMLRFYQLGMTVNEAIVKTFHFPFQITVFHISIFKMHKDKGYAERFKYLLMPIFNLSETLVTYGYAYIETRIEKEAILNLLSEITLEQKDMVIKKLVEQGTLIMKKDPVIHVKKKEWRIIDIQEQEYEIPDYTNFYKMNLKLKAS